MNQKLHEFFHMFLLIHQLNLIKVLLTFHSRQKILHQDVIRNFINYLQTLTNDSTYFIIQVLIQVHILVQLVIRDLKEEIV
jgi:hypothetical protein